MLKPGLDLSEQTPDQRRALSRWDNEGGAEPGNLAPPEPADGAKLDGQFSSRQTAKSSNMKKDGPMLADQNALRARLGGIETRIGEIRHRMELRGIFDKGHEATMAELQERQKILDRQLSDENDDIEAQGRHVSTLEQIVLNWGNKLSF
jgi:hypothetical protein